ncbi:hypothetical protein BGY98DRAFT_941867 [Russula aff. rugulosa BPL654]|nr:hypothetical protein BGY98DRAFT_941867 [Russula aff. rugulosa BPL654]
MSSIALARVYRRFFESYPHVTLAVAGGALTALGDVVAQLSEQIVGFHSVTSEEDVRSREFRYDIPRTLRFFCFGAGISPLIGQWNKYLEFRFPLRSRKNSATSFTALSKRVLVDQIFVAPIGLSIFLSSMGVMEGRDIKHIRGRFEDIYRPALLANWKIWPAAQFINFRFIPLPYRVPFQQTCGVFWTLYLSLINSAESRKQDEEDALKRTFEQQL